MTAVETPGVTSAALATATVGTVTVALVSRRGALAVTLGVVAVALSSLWWGIGGATRLGLPTPTTLRTLRHALRASRPLLSGSEVPLAHAAGIVILGTLAAGLVAVGGRALGTRVPLLAGLPAASCGCSDSPGY